MATEIRTVSTLDKDLHLSYETKADDKSVFMQVASGPNGKSVEHREHRLSLPSSANGHDTFPEADCTWYRVRRFMQEPFSEFFGVFALILFGDGSVAQVVLSNSTRGDYQSISWGWGNVAVVYLEAIAVVSNIGITYTSIGAMIGVYIAKKSGGHINPAVTLSNCIYRGFPWRKFPIYTIAQTMGGMAAAAVVYGNYIAAIDAFEGGPGIRTVGLNTSSAGIFCTYPAPFMTRTGMFFSEFIASGILMFCIYAFIDAGAGDLLPLCLFFLVFGIGATFGWETGYAINFARDFGPRLVSYMIGYGPGVWTAGGHYFWIPMIAPFLGCAFGGFLYDVFLYQGTTPINTPWMGLGRLHVPRNGMISSSRNFNNV